MADSSDTSPLAAVPTADDVAASSTVSIGDRMKAYEQAMQSFLKPDSPFLIRLDGHGFSKFTRGFTKPFDDRIQNAMAKTARDLMHEYRSASCYVASDEITLLFGPCAENETMPFGGKVLKLVSLTAGFASARFNHHLQAENYDGQPDLHAKVMAANAYFDSRIFALPSGVECLNNLIWRVRDTRRNSKAMFGQSFFSAKQLHKLSSKQIVEKVELEKGLRWADLAGKYRSGLLLKKQEFLRDGVDGKTGEPVVVTRRQYIAADWDSVTLSFDGENCTGDKRDALVAFLLSRKVPEDGAPGFEVFAE